MLCVSVSRSFLVANVVYSRNTPQFYQVSYWIFELSSFWLVGVEILVQDSLDPFLLLWSQLPGVGLLDCMPSVCLTC